MNRPDGELEIQYVKGDATQPQGDGNKIICHICNDIGAWGAGFVLAISKKWYAPELAYRRKKEFVLGTVDFIRVEDDIIVANMIAQHGVGRDINGNPPINYGAVRLALNTVNQHAKLTGSSIHAPMFGAGLSGGDWKVIEQIIKDVMSVPVTIYVLDEKYLPNKNK
jgi:O-acetyl-ADP-ribose deacetylase (regulator of RNase III)